MTSHGMLNLALLLVATARVAAVNRSFGLHFQHSIYRAPTAVHFRRSSDPNILDIDEVYLLGCGKMVRLPLPFVLEEADQHD